MTPRAATRIAAESGACSRFGLPRLRFAAFVWTSIAFPFSIRLTGQFERRALHSFRLSYWMHAGQAPRLLAFDAPDLDAAYAIGGKRIAEALGRPDDFVLLDRATGRFMVGAAIWSRNGFFRLAAEESPPMAQGAQDERAEIRA